jgi:hypothetical protein
MDSLKVEVVGSYLLFFDVVRMVYEFADDTPNHYGGVEAGEELR